MLGYQENPVEDKFDPPGSQRINKRRVKPVLQKFLAPGEVAAAFDELRDVLGWPARQVPGADA